MEGFYKCRCLEWLLEPLFSGCVMALRLCCFPWQLPVTLYLCGSTYSEHFIHINGIIQYMTCVWLLSLVWCLQGSSIL